MRAVWVVIWATSAACGGPAFDEASVLARAAERRSTGFVQINRAQTTSVHMGVPVNVWVTTAAAATYRAVDGDGGVFAPGTILVKEQLDPQGQVAVLTVMAKAPPGYAPEAGDWYWAQTTPAGVVNGGFSGQVGFCIRCHAPRAPNDWAWGVPQQNQR